jgi:hypothetical protein
MSYDVVFELSRLIKLGMRLIRGLMLSLINGEFERV